MTANFQRVALLALSLAFGMSGRAAERVIEATVVVKAPVARVWTAWTTTEGIKTFFPPDARIELWVDGPFEVYINPLAEPGAKGADDMRMLAFQENKMLAFTGNAPPHLPEVRQHRTHVVVRFTELSGDQTRVELHHDGWGEGAEWDLAFKYFSGAGPKVLGNLQKRFAEGPVDWSEWMASLRKYMEQEKAKKSGS